MATTERRVLKELGAKIRRARTRGHLTQETIAARTGIDYKRYQRLEQGAVNPTMRTLLRVSEAIGIDVWELMAEGPKGRTSGRRG